MRACMCVRVCVRERARCAPNSLLYIHARRMCVVHACAHPVKVAFWRAHAVLEHWR
jgi:hypothetical protein